MDAKTTALVLLCHQPTRNTAPRSMVASLGPALACMVESRLLDCALEDLAAWEGPRVVSTASPDAEWAAGLTPQPVKLIPDDSPDFGDRLIRVDKALRAAGAISIIYFRPGIPMLDQQYLFGAATALAQGATVIAHTLDGGVALMGSTRPWPSADFLPWERNSLGTRLALACRRAGHRVEVLVPLPAVSKHADFQHCRWRLEHDSRLARKRLAELLGAIARPMDRSEVLAVASRQCPEVATTSPGTPPSSAARRE